MYKIWFDTLIFSQTVRNILNGYITCIRPRLTPVCDYLLVNRNGTQLTRISDIFGRLVFQAIGKYIHPTRYRQIIETESAKKLTMEEQNALSEDQKHTSLVAKVHYQKLQSRHVAEKGRDAMDKLRDNSKSSNTLSTINESLTLPNIDLTVNITSEKQCGNESKKPMVKKKAAFSKLEDKFLSLAISKYKAGKWTSILSDPEYKFHPSRRPSTLFARAKLLNLI